MACGDVQEVHVGDVGTILRVTLTDDGVVLDASTATTKQIILKAPNAASVTKSASFTTDGTDGKIEYATLSGDLSVPGMWKIQAAIVMPSGQWKSQVIEFRVYDNL